ncbi:MAG TPA: hypothetical protein QF624_03110 [Dehalococcoidia bacterium]|nr:hypothetical protein [Dehalococcoidia bacterium]
MTTQAHGERRLTAFMENPDAPRPGNVIHSTDGGKDYGYTAALVGGVTVYGWTAPAIIDALGESWLDRGWVEVSFRRPTYPGDEMVARLVEQADGGHELTMDNQDGHHCLAGSAGLGDAPFLAEMATPELLTAADRPSEIPALTLDNAPVGKDMLPMAVPHSKDEAREYAIEKEADDNPLYQGEHPLIHPGWIAARMTPLMHHSFDYAPAIHAKSHIQHLARAEAGQTFTVAARCIDAYERKGHHYIVADGLLLAEDGSHVARVRHTTIFNVAKRG